MRKFILNSIFFLLFALLGYLLILFIWGSYTDTRFKPNLNYRKGSYGHLYTRINEIPKYNNVDVLFLGSSHTYRGFDTRLFKKAGYTNFNLGSSAQTPIQTKVLVDRYLQDFNPKTVIYEVYPGTISSDGVESSLDIIANDRIDLKSFKMAVGVNNIKVYNTLFYGFMYENLKSNNFKEPLEKRKDTYVSGGFVEREVSYYDSPRLNQLMDKKWKLKNEQLKNVESILEKIYQKNIKIILVYAPITKARYTSYSNHDLFDKLMENYAKKYDATYYNFNKIINVNDTLHFFDSHHLNQNGVEFFNNALINEIEL